jgi:hypothetical protein
VVAAAVAPTTTAAQAPVNRFDQLAQVMLERPDDAWREYSRFAAIDGAEGETARRNMRQAVSDALGKYKIDSGPNAGDDLRTKRESAQKSVQTIRAVINHLFYLLDDIAADTSIEVRHQRYGVTVLAISSLASAVVSTVRAVGPIKRPCGGRKKKTEKRDSSSEPRQHNHHHHHHQHTSRPSPPQQQHHQDRKRLYDEMVSATTMPPTFESRMQHAAVAATNARLSQLRAEIDQLAGALPVVPPPPQQQPPAAASQPPPVAMVTSDDEDDDFTSSSEDDQSSDSSLSDSDCSTTPQQAAPPASKRRKSDSSKKQHHHTKHDSSNNNNNKHKHSHHKHHNK